MNNLKAIGKKLIALWGIPAQLNVAIEECSELIQAICKYNRGMKNIDSIREEMADVKNMLEQMEIIFGSVDEIRKEKLERLEKVIDNLFKKRGTHE